jgi:D-threo-aldose 1-dehydrogenase
VSLPAAALQFSLRDPRVSATVVGISEPARIDQVTALMSEPISDDLWAELDTLAVPSASWLN